MGKLFGYLLLAIAFAVIVPRVFDRGAAVEAATATEVSCGKIAASDAFREFHRLVSWSLRSDLTPVSSGFCASVAKTPVSRVPSLFRCCANALCENRAVSSVPSTRMRFQQQRFDRWCAELQRDGYYVFSLRKIIV